MTPKLRFIRYTPACSGNGHIDLGGNRLVSLPRRNEGPLPHCLQGGLVEQLNARARLDGDALRMALRAHQNPNDGRAL